MCEYSVQIPEAATDTYFIFNNLAIRIILKNKDANSLAFLLKQDNFIMSH